jgi:protein-disulfide isomerase
MKGYRRRQVVAAAGLAIAGIAGCTGRADDTGTDGGATTGDGEGTTTDAGQSLGDHPAARDLGVQPTLGSADATATIVAFEDPSCSRCRAFERNTVPRIRDELVSSGEARFVVRTYPVVYPWGKPAVQALEATYARSPDAFWGLFAHYFDEQDAFSTDNVLTRTEAWLASNADVDAAAVIADAESKAYDGAVQTDLDAGEAAGVGRTTPTVFLFRDGRYVTRASGSVSFELVSSALGL